MLLLSVTCLGYGIFYRWVKKKDDKLQEDMDSTPSIPLPFGNPSAVFQYPFYNAIIILTAFEKYFLPFQKKRVFLQFEK